MARPGAVEKPPTQISMPVLPLAHSPRSRTHPLRIIWRSLLVRIYTHIPIELGSDLIMDGLQVTSSKAQRTKKGNLKDAGLMIGIKLDLEAEVHLTARVRGDVVIGLY